MILEILKEFVEESVRAICIILKYVSFLILPVIFLSIPISIAVSVDNPAFLLFYIITIPCLRSYLKIIKKYRGEVDVPPGNRNPSIYDLRKGDKENEQ